jgi:serine/threonine protein kinase
MPLMQRTAHASSRASRLVVPRGPEIPGFELLETLATGTQFEVRLARAAGSTSGRGSERSRADYVVKSVRPEANNRPFATALLQREALVAREVAHPNLVTVFSAGVHDGLAYLVLPYLTGSSLRQPNILGTKFTVPQALWYVRQAAEALEALHLAGWLHGDLKPSNLIVSDQGHVTLIDLGLARRLRSSECNTETWLAGDTSYLPPEALLPGFELTPAADIYSLGLTLLELLQPSLASGQRPLLDSWQVASQLRAARPEVGREVATLLAKMLATEPLRRPTLGELTSLLSRLEIESLMQW